VILSLEKSRALREQLISDLKAPTDTDALAAWAQGILTLKNQLTTLDAQEVEHAFAAKLDELSDDGIAPVDTPHSGASVGVGDDKDKSPTTISTAGSARKEGRSPGNHNGDHAALRAGPGENISADGVIWGTTAARSMALLSKPLRIRDRDH
jgi:hypothetical protein